MLHLSRKIIFPKLKIWCSKMQPLRRPADLLTVLVNMSLVLRLPRKMHLSRSSSNVPLLASFLEMPQNPHGLLTSDKVHNPLRRPRKTTSERPKVLQTRQFFALLTWKCAPRHNGVHFFDISTSKNAPNPSVFYTFDFEMCFRHNGVLFFISHLARWLRTRRFREPTFRPSGATNHWKNTMFCDVPTFSRPCIFFLLTLSLLWSSLFCPSLLWLFPPLAFPSVHIVGSLTSKLPSIIH